MIVKCLALLYCARGAVRRVLRRDHAKQIFWITNSDQMLVGGRHEMAQAMHASTLAHTCISQDSASACLCKSYKLELCSSLAYSSIW